MSGTPEDWPPGISWAGAGAAVVCLPPAAEREKGARKGVAKGEAKQGEEG